jgi:hypothetical protein
MGKQHPTPPVLPQRQGPHAVILGVHLSGEPADCPVPLKYLVWNKIRRNLFFLPIVQWRSLRGQNTNSGIIIGSLKKIKDIFGFSPDPHNRNV